MLKFAIPIFLALGFPLLGINQFTYTYVNSFPFGGPVHSSIVTAEFICKILFLAGWLGIVVGLINPKVVYFSKNPSRGDAFIYYSFLLFLSVLVHSESIYLAKIVEANKKAALIDFYKEIIINENTELLKLKVSTYKYSLKWSGGGSSDFVRVLGFPYKPPAREIMKVHFPGLAENVKIVLEISNRFKGIEPIVTRAILIENNRVLLSNPQLKPDDPQMLAGSFEKVDGNLIFRSCSDGIPLEADLSQLRDRFVFGFVDQPENGKINKRFVIFSGAIVSNQKCDNCANRSDKVIVFYGDTSGPDKYGICKQPTN